MVSYKTIIFRTVLLILSTFVISGNGICTTHTVGLTGKYKSVTEASKYASAGDTILIKTGEYFLTENITNLHGSENSWIVIRAEVPGKTVYIAGTHSFHLSDPRYVKIEGLSFSRQTGNGFNIDDGGSPETSARFIILENCTFLDINATGNNDELKMSGVDNFEIRRCKFMNGSKGGSMIDMVGCHNGIITENVFENGGSNAIQAKGGSKDIIISRNKFIRAGERAVNIGGSTGLQFFRPLGILYEASGIKVWANMFTGGIVPVAFVGSVNCEVVNNTIIKPEKWVIRILQENRAEGFVACGNNTFANNIIVITESVQIPVNIGPGTDPASFVFANNLWYNSDNTNWRGPALPASENEQILNKDPQFLTPDYVLKESSPAIGKGKNINKPETDFTGREYRTPRAIGAIEL